MSTTKETEENNQAQEVDDTDLKNACDDGIQKFSQIHTHADIKLILGYLSCGFAMFGGYYGHITPFNDSKMVVIQCVIVYLILNLISFIYTFFIEKDIIFDGKKQDDSINYKITIHTNSKRYSDIYNITFEFVGKETTGNKVSIRNSNFSISKSFGYWFDVNGVMDQERFEGTLKEGLEAAITGKKTA
ncbi:8476_t:CDS:2 [Diversispora eburnea]|uniref:Signal peptidase complex subunit 2 n=1 Tax=Diversispora eburnea TaxID=1213867 RepID=A0A9N9FBN1_9GLOM|nr:8476_t:CDS:2 [Diversispora eburnea]